jgi:hypothetical protein
LKGCRLSWAGLRKMQTWDEATKTYRHPAVIKYLASRENSQLSKKTKSQAAKDRDKAYQNLKTGPQSITAINHYLPSSPYIKEKRVSFAKFDADAFKRIYSVYKPECRPTRCKRWLDSQPSNLKDLAQQAMVFYPQAYSFEQAFTLASQREPVNIEMKRQPYYHEAKLQEQFGYRRCPYGGADVSPNLAVFTRTPFWPNAAKASASPPYIANVLHLIGAALDSEEQPDYEAFYKHGVLNMGHLIKFYRQVYTMMIKAALVVQRRHKRPMKLVLVGLIGSAAFWQLPDAAQYNYDDHITPVLDALIHDYADQLTIRVVHYGEADNTFSLLQQGKVSQAELDSTILTNAWDCWSMLGNGNEKDDSLDGFYGRASAIAALGWPTCNQYIQFVPIQVALAFDKPTLIKRSTAENNRYARETVDGLEFEMLVDDNTGLAHWQRLARATHPYPDDYIVRSWLQHQVAR